MGQRRTSVVFAQGMRRSGTTIVFDMMLENRDYVSYYEPEGIAKAAGGGGSGLNEQADLSANVREQRRLFFARRPDLLERYPDIESGHYLNYGAPRLAALEFEPQLPPFMRDYVQQLAASAERVFIKFTRMHSKVFCLKEISPEAKFVHIVRDPKNVVMSYLFGKGGAGRQQFVRKGDYFSRISDLSRWSSRDFSDHLMKIGNFPDPGAVTDLERVLIVWRYKFLTTCRQGRAAFGDNYYLLRHEDLTRDPKSEIARFYDFLGDTPPPALMDWAKANLRPAEEPYLASDRRWKASFDKVDMWQSLAMANYAA